MRRKVARKKKEDKPLYDQDGRWVEERGRIKGAIRRSFRLSPQMKEVLISARVELPPAVKKDGTPGKRPQVRFRCACCNKLFAKMTSKKSNVQVDHIDPVVPLWISEKSMTYDEIVRGVFCGVENLQVLCSVALKRNNNIPSCHALKTREENWIRKKMAKIEKMEDRLEYMKIAKKEYQKTLKKKKVKK